MGVLAEAGSSILLFALVFGMSATVEVDNLRKQLRNKNALLTGIFLQFVVLPFLGFAVVKALGMSSAMGITLLVVTSSPGGSYSNWWCSMFNADLALSVTMTAISTLMSIIMLPVNLVIYATSSYSGAVVKSLDWGALFTSLTVVISAILLGLYCSYRIKSHKFNLIANKLGNIAGVALVAFSAWISSSDQDAELWGRDWKFYLGVAAPCVLGLVLANFLTSFFNLAYPERVSVSVECCYQNVGIATSVAITMFDDDALAEAVGVPLYYGMVEAVILGIYCIGAWKAGWTKAPKKEKFCVVIVTSYEVEEAELQDPDAVEVVLGMRKEDGLPEDLIFYHDESDGYTIDSRSLESASNPSTPERSVHSKALPPLEQVEEKEEECDTGGPLFSVKIERGSSPIPPPNKNSEKYMSLPTDRENEHAELSPNTVPNTDTVHPDDQRTSHDEKVSPSPLKNPDVDRRSLNSKEDEGKGNLSVEKSDGVSLRTSRPEESEIQKSSPEIIGRSKLPLRTLPLSRKSSGYQKATTRDDEEEPDVFDEEALEERTEPAD
eukprot:CAMPEP_0185726574 /NCGR_PEP_ID=MMETSP1171-20130828/2515_1 /TAXON_ID=374046 /ORGANISM="Helicotheca tamensis, Strain CCMP826" /LENGTH=549 /DNA_ID=CAMNT_0028394959 /DNA_START=171 /DNA_END=1820 /DNA_ORIENTATION=-